MPCEAGTYSDSSVTPYVCRACGAGTYQDQAFQTACKPCPSSGVCGPGYYLTTPCSGASSGGCSQCPAGTYKIDASHSCTPCPPETYNDRLGRYECLEITRCRPGQYVRVVPTASSDAVCGTCSIGDLTTVLGSETSCNACIAGKYMMGGRCATCSCSGLGEYYSACPTGSTQLGCAACTGGDQSVSKCAPGMEPAVRCDGTQTTDPGCANCPAGKQKPNADMRYCEPCPGNTYKPTRASTDCIPCTNKPPGALSVYRTERAYRVDNSCSWSCVAGYYKPVDFSQCVSCATTAGMYAPAGTEGTCLRCNKAPYGPSYYQLPAAVGGFDATTNDCPW